MKSRGGPYRYALYRHALLYDRACCMIGKEPGTAVGHLNTTRFAGVPPGAASPKLD